MCGALVHYMYILGWCEFVVVETLDPQERGKNPKLVEGNMACNFRLSIPED